MSIALGTPEAQRLWPAVWKLLRLRLTIFFNNFRRSRLRYKIGMAVLALFISAFLGVLFFLSWQFLRLVQTAQFQEITTQFNVLFDRVPVMVFSATFLGIFITSFGVLLQALYLAGDMDFLLATPVPIRAVFIAKLLQAILPNFALICLFSLPILFGLATASDYSLLYYPAVILIMAALALAAAGLSGLLVMLVVRIIPARRVAEVLGFLGAIFSFVCSQSGQLARFGDFNEGQAIETLTWLQRIDPAWSPLAWAGRGVTALGTEKWATGLGLTILSLALAAGIFAVSLATVERLYYAGWAGMQTASRKKRTTRPANAGGLPARFAERLIPAPIRGILLKDWLVLRRDLRNLSQLVTPLILGIVYAVMVLSGSDEVAIRDDSLPPLAEALFSNFNTYAGVGLSLFVGWMLLGRLAGMGFAQEGKSFWLLKTSPVRSGQMIIAKFLVAFLPTLALSLAYFVIIRLIQSAPFLTILYSLLVIALSIAGNAGINLASGIIGANLNWDDPRHMQRTASGCLGVIASLVYLPLCMLLFFGPAIALPAFGLPEIAGQAIGLALGGTLSLACAIVPLFLVRQRVDRLGEG